MSIIEQINAAEKKVLVTLARLGFATVQELAQETGIDVDSQIVQRIIARHLVELEHQKRGQDWWVEEYGDDTGQYRVCGLVDL